MGLFDFLKQKPAPPTPAQRPAEIPKVVEQAHRTAAPPPPPEQPKTQEELADIAINAPNWYANEEAAKELTDQSLIAKVAVESREELARIQAVYKLEDTVLLAKISQSDSDSNVRKAAARMLTQKKPVDASESERIKSAAGRTEGLLLRCGGCGSQDKEQLSVVLDNRNNRGVLCEQCTQEYMSLLREGSGRRFWQCGNCNFRVLAGTKMDAAVDPDSRCPNCRADVNVTLVNLSNDQRVASGAIGEPLS